MAFTKGNIGNRYGDEDIITKSFKDTSATTHEANRVVTLNNAASDGLDYASETLSFTSFPLGVTISQVETTSTVLEKQVDIQTDGIALIKATAATISAEDEVEAVADGKIQTKAGSGFRVGFALKDAAAGEIIPVKMAISKG